SIRDKNVEVGKNAILGTGDDNTPNILRPDILNWGVNLVGKGSSIPERMTIHRNCIVGIGISKDHFGGTRELKSGSVVM
ncbi:MAG: hypothetical protein WCP87_07410, partial [Atribacterota bacterium]